MRSFVLSLACCGNFVFWIVSLDLRLLRHSPRGMEIISSDPKHGSSGLPPDQKTPLEKVLNSWIVVVRTSMKSGAQVDDSPQTPSV